MINDVKELMKINIIDTAKKLGIKVIKNSSLCFLHEENTPSLIFNQKDNYWHCFGCGKGGNVINLVKEYHKLSFKDACKWLENESNIEINQKIHISKFGKSYIKNTTKQKVIGTKSPDPEVYKFIIEKCSLSKAAKDFLIIERKYSRDIIDKLKVRSIEDPSWLSNVCREQFEPQKLIKSGVFKEKINKSTGEVFEDLIWWGKTIIFPFFDRNENIVYLQGRSLEQDLKYRYVNLNNIPTMLYNLNILNNIGDGENLVITEGVTDCLAVLSMGKAAVGVIGASGFKKEFVNLLKGYQIVIIPDNDDSGKNFAIKIKNSFDEIDKEILIINSEYKDISEYYMKEFKNE